MKTTDHMPSFKVMLSIGIILAITGMYLGLYVL